MTDAEKIHALEERVLVLETLVFHMAKTVMMQGYDADLIWKNYKDELGEIETRIPKL